jgi:hypothetical protein
MSWNHIWEGTIIGALLLLIGWGRPWAEDRYRRWRRSKRERITCSELRHRSPGRGSERRP